MFLRLYYIYMWYCCNLIKKVDYKYTLNGKKNHIGTHINVTNKILLNDQLD